MPNPADGSRHHVLARDPRNSGCGRSSGCCDGVSPNGGLVTFGPIGLSAVFGVEEARRMNQFEIDDGGVLSWQERALCAQTDPEAFFPEKGGSTREAKRVCQSCEVRAECLEYALAHDERFGIWGGLSERERRRLKKQAGSPPAGRRRLRPDDPHHPDPPD